MCKIGKSNEDLNPKDYIGGYQKLIVTIDKAIVNTPKNHYPTRPMVLQFSFLHILPHKVNYL